MRHWPTSDKEDRRVVVHLFLIDRTRHYKELMLFTKNILNCKSDPERIQYHVIVGVIK